MIRKILTFLKKFLFGKTVSWVDIELSTAPRPDTAPTIHLDPPTPKGWCIPQMEDIDCKLLNGKVTVEYSSKSNNIKISGEPAPESELTITTRIFTKVNNVLKKSDVDVISKELWTEFEEGIIKAQGRGKNTYKALRYPAKKS